MDILDVLSKEELQKHSSSNLFADYNLDISMFKTNSSVIDMFRRYHLEEMLYHHNNSVKVLRITYAFCRHYYDAGIDDASCYKCETKYKSSDKSSDDNRQNRFWFCYFAEIYYLKMYAIMEYFLKIMNESLKISKESDGDFKCDFLKKLSQERSDLNRIIQHYYQDDIARQAKDCRHSIAHSIFIGHAHDMTVIKEINNKTKIEFGRGVYIDSKDILSNMEEYTLLSGSLIKDILSAL